MRELNHRTNHGTEVTLLWDPPTNRLFVSIGQAGDDASLEFEVTGADALDAFHHPYSYAEPGLQPLLHG